ncbi:MAG: DNA-processing protein DprA [Deltaproteobacteria bacterium]|nr:DNA-processing protein DprA [Deltaproteobacteria bacterium]
MAPSSDHFAATAAWIALGAAGRTQGNVLREIRERHGSPAGVIEPGAAAAPEIAGLDPALRERAHRLLDWAGREIGAVRRAGGEVVSYGDAGYPALLREIPDPPAWLAVQGEWSDAEAPAVAVIGSRSACPAGVRRGREWSAWLARRGVAIISGLAHGVDGAAHEGALEGGGRTAAVLGCGLDISYPRRHLTLREAIVRGGGAVMSELPIGTQPAPWTFPRRNRLISGLARGVLVIQAAERSGTSITARLALDQGREVWAVPGTPEDPRARGTNALIRQGARLVESPEEVLGDLLPGWPGDIPPKMDDRSMIQAMGGLTEEEMELLAGLKAAPADIDTIAARAQLTIEQAAATLLDLEMRGEVKRLPGMRFSKA